MDRNTVLWLLVLFFGASVVFAGLRNLTEDEGIAVTLGVQVAALALIVGAVVLVVRRRS
ncbi:MAG: hypothetical protein WD844_01840 [Thermoleophilaceae bacterium]